MMSSRPEARRSLTASSRSPAIIWPILSSRSSEGAPWTGFAPPIAARSARRSAGSSSRAEVFMRSILPRKRSAAGLLLAPPLALAGGLAIGFAGFLHHIRRGIRSFFDCIDCRDGSRFGQDGVRDWFGLRHVQQGQLVRRVGKAGFLLHLPGDTFAHRTLHRIRRDLERQEAGRKAPEGRVTGDGYPDIAPIGRQRHQVHNATLHNRLIHRLLLGYVRGPETPAHFADESGRSSTTRGRSTAYRRARCDAGATIPSPSSSLARRW